MKNAMKKLMSLLLVAVLLVSAVPFQAEAADENSATIVLKVNGDVVDTQVVNFREAPTTFAKLEQYGKVNLSAVAGATFSHTWKADMGGSKADKGIEINNGEEIHVAYTKEVPTQKQYCWICGEEVAAGAQHTCAKETCGTCGEEYIKNTKHECSLVKTYCYLCGEQYVQGTQHTCPTTDTEEVKPITVVVKVNESNNIVVAPFTKVPANGEYALVKNLLTYCWNSDWEGVYEFDRAWSKTNNKTTYNDSAKIYAGDEVHIMLKTINNGDNTGNSGNTGNTGNNGNISYNPSLWKPVYLDIYMNGNAMTYNKRVDITNGIAADGTVTWKDVYNNIILTNYTAKTSAGITMDGPYLDDVNGGNWESAWTYNGGIQPDVTGINEMRQKSTVVINVMIYNANVKTTSSAVADSSNPKTGDSITTAMAVMGISAASLAAVMYVYGKKRQAI